MLKHMLTQAGGAGGSHSLPATPAARNYVKKLASRGANSSLFDDLDHDEDACGPSQAVLSPTILSGMDMSPPPSGGHQRANLTLNQSIYANTVALPKINGEVVGRARRPGQAGGRHGSSGSNGSSGKDTSKLSSSNSPATTNQTKTSYMDSSRDHSHHELESTQLSPIARTAVPPAGLARADTNSTHVSANSTRLGAANASRAGARTLNLSTTMDTSRARALLPANVSKFMLLTKEAGVRVAITSLGLLCLISLLLALLALVFLLRITPPSAHAAEARDAAGAYEFDFLSPTEFASLYEVTLALCALTLVLNLCCLLVCAIQFLFAIKLVKSPHGRHRTAKYLRGAAATRVCAIGGFFVSIPLFLTGVILYTFLHFDSTPAIVSSIVIGLGIVFCGGAVVHNVFVWQKEKTATVSKSEATSPVLTRNQNKIFSDRASKSTTMVGGLPQATLDLSGQNSKVLELSTLV